MLAIAPDDLARFRAICERERCPFAVVGGATAEPRLVVDDRTFGNEPVDMSARRAYSASRRRCRAMSRASRARCRRSIWPASRFAMPPTACCSSPRSPTRRFSSRSATAPSAGCARAIRWSARGRFRSPTVAVTLGRLRWAIAGEAMAMGERTPLALIDAPASGRMAVARRSRTSPPPASTRSATSSCRRTGWPPRGQPGEDAALYDTVHAVGAGAVRRDRHRRSRSARIRCRCARRGATATLRRRSRHRFR